jgi:hypothetical protein
MALIRRLKELWNSKGRLGLWRAGKTKVCSDYLLRDPANPYVPGTDVLRAKVTYLGPKLPIVTEAEVERLPRELGEFYANAQRIERDQALERDKGLRRERDRRPRTSKRDAKTTVASTT